jgi:hypothetical protein
VYGHRKNVAEHAKRINGRRCAELWCAVEYLFSFLEVNGTRKGSNRENEEGGHDSTEALFGVADRLPIHDRIGDHPTSPGTFAGTVKTNRGLRSGASWATAQPANERAALLARPKRLYRVSLPLLLFLQIL